MRQVFIWLCGLFAPFALGQMISQAFAISITILAFGCLVVREPVVSNIIFQRFNIGTRMAEIITMACIGGLAGFFIFGSVHFVQYKLDEAEKERIAIRANEEKRKLSPMLRIKLFADLPDTQPYKPPLKRYHLYIDNANPNSVKITNLRMEFNFKHVIDNVRKQVILPDLRGGATLGHLEAWSNKEDGSQDFFKDEPRNDSVNRKFTFEIDQENINKTLKNTNIVILEVEKWDEQGSSFHAEIVLDTSKQPHIQKQLGARGTYAGKYSYEIAGKPFTERIHEKIADEPLGWQSYTIPLHRKNRDEPGSRSD